MVSCGIGYAALCLALQHFPRTDRNPLYQQARLRRELEKLMDDFAHTIELEHLADGWQSNYRLYEASMRAKWGHRPSGEVERERGDAADRVDGGGVGDVDRQEYGGGAE